MSYPALENTVRRHCLPTLVKEPLSIANFLRDNGQHTCVERIETSMQNIIELFKQERD